MPIYEYMCHNCNRKVSLFLRIADMEKKHDCPACGKPGLVRTVSCFAIHKSIGTIHEESGEPGASRPSDYYKDPRNIGRGIEKRFKDMNVEIPSEIRQSIDEAREGKLPDSIKDLNSGTSADSAYS